MFPLINKQNFILSSRRDNERVALPQRGGATQKLDKICLLKENLDFGQNQDFNLGEIFI